MHIYYKKKFLIYKFSKILKNANKPFTVEYAYVIVCIIKLWVFGCTYTSNHTYVNI